MPSLFIIVTEMFTLKTTMTKLQAFLPFYYFMMINNYLGGRIF